jgi:adenylate cyclase
MGKEIERKFLVKGNFKKNAISSNRIKQGYLSSVMERIVRVRIMDEQAFITVKGRTDDSGMSRYEWEMEIDKTEAEDLLKLCESGIIDKTRYLIEFDKHTWEVDEFYGENEGLLVAEIELRVENEKFQIPNWVGEEVTGEDKYYNAMLRQFPFCGWDDQD